MAHLSERLSAVERVDRDAEVTKAAYQALRRGFAKIALGAATFADSIAALIAVFLH